MPRVSRLLTAVVAVAVIPAMAGCGFFDDEPSTQRLDVAVGGTRVKVVAPVTGGDVVVVPVGERGAELEFAEPLSPAVHISVEDGALDGVATVSFPIDAATLPEGVDPASGWVGIYARGEESGQEWEWLGGVWDPAAQEISVQTEHFSDWVLATTSFPELDAKKPYADLFNSEGGWFSDVVRGDIKELSCSSDQVPWRFAYSTGAGPDTLGVCIVSDPDSGIVTVELQNKRPLPLEIGLPKGLVPAADYFTGEGVVNEYAAVLYEAISDERFLLQGESVARFTVAEGVTFNPGTIVPVRPADAAWLSDLAANFWDLVTADVGDSVGPLTTRGMTATEAKKVLDCVSSAAGGGEDLTQASEDERREAMVEAAQDVIVKCYDLGSKVLDEGVKKAGKLEALKGRFRGAYDRLKKFDPVGRVVSVWDLMDTAGKTARQEIWGLMDLALPLYGGPARGFTTFDLRIGPPQWPLDPTRVLPGEGATGRDYTAFSKWYGMPNLCGGDFPSENFVLYDARYDTDDELWSGLPAFVVGTYPTTLSADYLGDVEVYVSLIAPERQGPVRDQMEGWPSSCEDDFGIGYEGYPGSPVWTETQLRVPTDATVRMYETTPAMYDGPATSGPSLNLWVVSEATMLQLRLRMPVGADPEEAQAEFERVYRQVGTHLDRTLRTRFVSP